MATCPPARARSRRPGKEGARTDCCLHERGDTILVSRAWVRTCVSVRCAPRGRGVRGQPRQRREVS